MKWTRIGLLCLLNCALAWSLQGQDIAQPYQFTVNLNQAPDDQLVVELAAPPLSQTSITYYMPSIVPGTYSLDNFGRFVSQFEALDSQGNPLPVEKVGVNGWRISQANLLKTIRYQVEDTWDTEQPEAVFEPGGTNIEESENYVINTHGFFGFFEGMERHAYRIRFNRPETFYGSTSLIPVESGAGYDIFEAPHYMRLVDSPIMYNEPDTTVLQVGGADVLVSVYSPNGLVTSSFVAENIQDVLEAQKDYLGGELPIRKYAFIIYLSDRPSLSGMMGALEHSYSSLYYLPEIQPQYLVQSIRDIAAHEFFHILTPLSIHSEQIHNFDYINPEMSKHLWLYEGVTEYFASHVQVRHGLITIDEYLGEIRNKMIAAQAYQDALPFTVMSKGCLGEYKDEYGNVYEKGALIGLCLDIRLRELSKGRYGLQQLMADLSKEYGIEKPFEDDKLFDEIARISGFPEIRTFFAKYVEGSEPLPFEETFETVGIRFEQEQEIKGISLGNVDLNVNENDQIYIESTENVDEFGKKMKYKEDDVLFSINGKELNLGNAKEIFTNLRENAQEGDRLEVIVLRGKKMKKKKLKADMMEITTKEEFIFGAIENPTFEQSVLLRSWLKPE